MTLPPQADAVGADSFREVARDAISLADAWELAMRIASDGRIGRRVRDPEIVALDRRMDALEVAHADLTKQRDDYALVGAAMIFGVARFEPFKSRALSDGVGELCFGGLRYVTKLDGSSMPILSAMMRDSLHALLSRIGAGTP